MPYTTKRTKRKVKKRVYKKRASNTFAGGETALHMPMTRTLQLLPDRYYCKGRASFIASITLNAGIGTDARWHVQFLGNSIVQNNVNNNGGGFAISCIPSGLSYLLGDNNASAGAQGGNAPYLNYRVSSSSVSATYIPIGTATGIPVQMTVIPYIGSLALYANMVSVNLREQPYCRYKTIPAYVNTEQKPLRSRMNTLQLFGDKYKATLENGQFDGTYSAPPSSEGVWTWLISLATLQATVTDYTSIGSLMVDVVYDIELFNRNLYTSLVPS